MHSIILTLHPKKRRPREVKSLVSGQVTAGLRSEHSSPRLHACCTNLLIMAPGEWEGQEERVTSVCGKQQPAVDFTQLNGLLVLN